MRFQPALAWELARKDWKLFFGDRQAALLCFAVPILLASAFGAVFHRPDGNRLPRLQLTIADEGDSEFSRAVVAALCVNPDLSVRIENRAEGLRWLERQTAGVSVVLPSGFGSGAREPEAEIVTHPGNEYQGRWAEGALIEAYLQRFAKDWLGTAVAEGLRRPFRVSHAHLPGMDGLSVNSYSHSFCGMTLQYLLFWGMDSGLLLLRERRRGLWRRMRAAPLGLGTLLAGKVLSTAAIALMLIVLTFGFGWAVFGVRVTGSLWGFLLLALAAALLSAAVGLLVAALGGNEARARSLSIVAILTLSLLGGLWLPFGFLPEWVQRIAEALPTTWAARGFEGVTWRGMGWSAAWPCAAMLAGFSAVFLAVALWRLRCSEARIMCKGES